jgi:hypothetical protein
MKKFSLLIAAAIFGLAAFTSTASAATLWSADHETGNLSQWDLNGGGGMFNNGSFESVASTDVAHTGSWSLRAKIWTDAGGDNGVRAFRWAEPQANRDAYYSAWLYIPNQVTINGWWQVFQFKSRSTSGAVDPFWYMEIIERADGTLGPKFTWWNGLTVEGPHQGESGGRAYQSSAVIPVGQWFHIEAYLHQSKDFDGRLTMWLNGTQIFDQTNVRTSYNNCNYNTWCTSNEWSVKNYGNFLSPSPTTLYIDDAVISTT